MEKKKTQRTEHDSFVELMVTKSQKKETVKPDIPIRNPKKDGHAKPYLIDTNKKEIKKIEKITKELVDKLK
ncbi:MAG: hypothetical protein ISS82_04170 [Nanoarchaeota archaeon]|nr:hypothetical protein [Nanoarchaeota archaeon]